MADPFTSPAKKQELAEEAARRRKMLLFGGGGLLLVVVLAVIGYFTLFGGAKSDALSDQDKDVQNMKFINQRLGDLGPLVEDKSLTKSEKDSYLKERKDLEKQRDELLKKRPDLK